MGILRYQSNTKPSCLPSDVTLPHGRRLVVSLDPVLLPGHNWLPKKWHHQVSEPSSKIDRVAGPRVAAWSQLAAKEMAPPSFGAFKQDLQALAQNMPKVTDLTMNQVAGRALVLVEIPLWFYFGEIIGRGSLV